MSLFKLRTWGLVKVIRDFENYRDWKHTIQKEEQNPKSKYNTWKLNRNFFYTVYVIESLDETSDHLPENIRRLRLIEKLAPLHIYLDEELGFAGSLIPEFNQFYDDEDKPTLSYLISYRFAFNKFSIKWLVKWVLILGISCFIVFRFDLIPMLIQWVGNLIAAG